jgi:hypothetical protein
MDLPFYIKSEQQSAVTGQFDAQAGRVIHDDTPLR